MLILHECSGPRSVSDLKRERGSLCHCLSLTLTLAVWVCLCQAGEAEVCVTISLSPLLCMCLCQAGEAEDPGDSREPLEDSAQVLWPSG